MVKDFVDRVFDGASGTLLVHLAKDNRLTAKQRLALERLLEDLEDSAQLLTAGNLVAYALQVAVLIAVTAAVLTLLRVRSRASGTLPAAALSALSILELLSLRG